MYGIVCYAQAAAQEKADVPSAPLSMDLRDAVRLALSPRGSYEIGIATENIQIAHAEAQQAHGAFLPEIDGSVTAENQRLDLAAAGLQSIKVPLPGYTVPVSSGQFTVYDEQLHVRQNFFDLSASRRSGAARASLDVARNETDEVKDQVAAHVAQLYLANIRADSLVNLQTQAVASQSAHLQSTIDRNKEGKAIELEVAQSRTQLAAAKQALLQAEMDRSRLRLELLDALNLDLGTRLKLPKNPALPEQKKETPDESVAQALKTRSDYLALQKRLQAAQLSDSAISSQRLPSLSGFADVGSVGTNETSPIATYDVGVSIKVPIFDRESRSPQRAEAQSALRQERFRLAELRSRIELEVREAFLKTETAKGLAETTAREVEVAELEQEHLHRLVDQGHATALQLSDAELELARARDEHVAASIAWSGARIDLLLAEGAIQSLAR